jgi:hypothetical protein
MRCLVAAPGARYEWHAHPFEEFSLVSEGSTVIGYDAGRRPTKPNTLLLYRRGERHGAWCSREQTPRFWVLHFDPGIALARRLPVLSEARPEHRVWELSDNDAEVFQWHFLRILQEQTQQRPRWREAESAWLQLLLIAVQRWAAGEPAASLQWDTASPELMRLCHLLDASAVHGAGTRLGSSLPNYDSLRHGFKKAFGVSPREMLLRLRMQQAKSFLLDSRLSIKEVAARLGYRRQHEFTRAFHKHAGVSPSEWRQDPLAIAPTAGEHGLS